MTTVGTARADTVELLADGGAAATSSDFFRSAGYLHAEATTHTLIVRTPQARLALPILVREIPAGGFDAISPYGYPGGSLQGEPPAAEDLDLSGSGLVSLFVRDRVECPSLRGGTRRNALLLHDPARPRHVRKGFAYEARRNERWGFTTEVVPGPDTADDLLEGFAAAYTETMVRTGAAHRYFFSHEYLRSCLDGDRTWLAVTRAPSGELAAGLMAVVSDGVLHYFLAGSRDGHLRASPAKNALVRLLDLADELRIPLNLGGGLQAGDGLEDFKRGFANAESSFVTHELICDRDRYDELAAGRGTTGFFPAYRGG